MFSLFQTIGSVLRNVFALSFAAIWGLSSMMLDLKQIADLAWASRGSMVLVLGLVGASVIAGFVALVLYLRDGGRKKQAGMARAGEADMHDFDPDQIITAYLARRNRIAPPTQISHATKLPLLRPAQGFGRKLR